MQIKKPHQNIDAACVVLSGSSTNRLQVNKYGYCVLFQYVFCDKLPNFPLDFIHYTLQAAVSYPAHALALLFCSI